MSIFFFFPGEPENEKEPEEPAYVPVVWAEFKVRQRRAGEKYWRWRGKPTGKHLLLVFLIYPTSRALAEARNACQDRVIIVMAAAASFTLHACLLFCPLGWLFWVKSCRASIERRTHNDGEANILPLQKKVYFQRLSNTSQASNTSQWNKWRWEDRPVEFQFKIIKWSRIALLLFFI